MYKFKNVKKLLIEFSRGEGLSVPTDSIKFVKVDGDELSGAVSGGSSGSGNIPTVKSLMDAYLNDNENFSDCEKPDAYFYMGDTDLQKLDTVEHLWLFALASEGLDDLIPAYSVDTLPMEGDKYIGGNWVTISAQNVDFEAVVDNDEYTIAVIKQDVVS